MWVWVGVAAVLVFVVYPLSIGPVALVEEKVLPRYLPPAWVEAEVAVTDVFYWPVMWVVRSGPGPVLTGFRWYISLWFPERPAAP